MSHFRLFSTARLQMRELQFSDAEAFFDMMENPNVMRHIPRPPMTREESTSMLSMLIEQPKEKTIWTICEKGSDECIGLAALLVNDEGNDEIGYRLRERFWGKGYGTEVAKGLIAFAFTELKTPLITADVYVENVRSIRILEKFMSPIREFYNPDDECTDRRYHLRKSECKIDLEALIQVDQDI